MSIWIGVQFQADAAHQEWEFAGSAVVDPAHLRSDSATTRHPCPMAHLTLLLTFASTTYAMNISRFFELGLNIPEVAVISGHKDPRMLFRYTHLRAVDLVNRL